MSRKTHGITWTDDLAWMESMRGPKWTNLIRKHQRIWAAKTDLLKGQIASINAELAEKSDPFLFHAAKGEVEIQVGNSRNIRWRFKDSSIAHDCKNLVASVKGDCVWDIDDVGEGAEVYAVRLYKRGYVETKPLWQIKGISPDIAIVGGRCYYLEVKKKLVYWRLASCNALTGKDKQVHYEETDYRYNLEIIRGDDTHAYMRRQAGAKQDCFMITPGCIEGLVGITQESSRHIFGSHAGEYMRWTRGTGWTKSPALVKAGWKLPSTAKAVPERLDTRRGIMITRWKGCRTLWSIHRSSEPKIKWRGWGSLMLDPWDSQWIRLVRPGTEAYWWAYDSALPVEPLANKEFGKIHFAISADGSEVPFYVIHNPSAKGLIVTGYGAYGFPTNLSTHMWKPLLDRGWSLAIGLWRGGGDHTPEWADTGRCSGRAKVLEDAEAVVRAAQRATGVGPSKTLLHGRSAGGLWVGGLLTREGSACAAGGYMEFPYLDALRTTTNRTLPLTDIEADEFGLPDRSFAEFVDVASWSPMERIPAKGLPGVLQIVRTALNDSQVYAYESVKWITRSRCSDAYLAVEGGQGHFPSADKNNSQQAQDLAVILNHFA